MSAREQLWIPDRAEGEFRADEVDLFRFSAATWNAHRIHYDRAQAEADGLPGLVVQSQMHGAWFAQVARSVAGPSARLRTLTWANRKAVIAGETVQVIGTVTAVDEVDGAQDVGITLTELNADGDTCGEGRATLRVTAEDAP
jgi:hydroxyacyl-ACP dehydratase HTD2-like protein with hotdog domain